MLNKKVKIVIAEIDRNAKFGFSWNICEFCVVYACILYMRYLLYI